MFKWIRNDWARMRKSERIRVLVALVLMVISMTVCYNSWMNHLEAKERYGELRREILRMEGAIDV